MEKKIQVMTETTTLVDSVEESLLQYIKENNLRLGDKLLHEEELSTRLGVGRAVVREALSRLRSLGILESRKRRGIIIKEPDIKKNLAKMINPNMLTSNTLNDLLELRYILELGIIPMLFNRITQKDIHDMELILAKCSISDGIRVPLEDEIAFHSRIYQIVGNKMMMDLQQLLIPMYRYIHDNYIEFSKYNGRIDTKHFATHYDLLLALKSRNKVIYEQIIQRHLMAYQMYVEEHRDN